MLTAICVISALFAVTLADSLHTESLQCFRECDSKAIRERLTCVQDCAKKIREERAKEQVAMETPDAEGEQKDEEMKPSFFDDWRAAHCAKQPESRLCKSEDEEPKEDPEEPKEDPEEPKEDPEEPKEDPEEPKEDPKFDREALIAKFREQQAALKAKLAERVKEFLAKRNNECEEDDEQCQTLQAQWSAAKDSFSERFEENKEKIEASKNALVARLQAQAADRIEAAKKLTQCYASHKDCVQNAELKECFTECVKSRKAGDEEPCTCAKKVIECARSNKCTVRMIRGVALCKNVPKIKLVLESLQERTEQDLPRLEARFEAFSAKCQEIVDKATEETVPDLDAEDVKPEIDGFFGRKQAGNEKRADEPQVEVTFTAEGEAAENAHVVITQLPVSECNDVDLHEVEEEVAEESTVDLQLEAEVEQAEKEPIIDMNGESSAVTVATTAVVALIAAVAAF